MLNGLYVGCIARLYVCFLVPPANAKIICRQRVWKALSILMCRRYGIQLLDPYNRMEMQMAL